MNISLCTVIMNRTEFTKGPYQSWVSFPFQEIVIVDWSSDVPIRTYLPKDTSFGHRVRIVEVRGKKRFDINKARNLAIRNTSGAFVMLVDQDVGLCNHFFRSTHIDIDKLYRGGYPNGTGTTGTCLFFRKWFYKVNGYHEGMCGAGGGDNDFYERCQRAGAELKSFNRNVVFHYPHNRNLGTKGYDIKDIKKSCSNNTLLAKEKPWTSRNKISQHDFTIYHRSRSGVFREVSIS